VALGCDVGATGNGKKWAPRERELLPNANLKARWVQPIDATPSNLA